MSDFDNELNVAYHKNVQDQVGLSVGDMAGGALATVVDFGASVWNGLPGTTEVDTGDILRRINNNAAKVYEESPDSIHTLSFLGGMILPGMGATKGMGMMRAGAKGMDWFSAAGKEARMAEVETMFKGAQGATKEYRNALWKNYAINAGNEALDAIAAEAAVMGTLHAHPLMEDYMEDPVKNFAISAAFGGVLGGVIGTVADHYTVRALTGKAMEDSVNTIFGEGYTMTRPNMTNAVALSKSSINVKNLENMIAAGADAGKTETNDLTMDLATKLLKVEQRQNDDIWKGFIDSKLMDGWDAEQQAVMKRMFENSPEMMGVTKVSKLTTTDINSGSISNIQPLETKPIISKTKTDAAGNSYQVNREGVFFPETGLFGTAKDIRHYGGANVISTNVEDFTKNLGKAFGLVADDSHSWELIRASAPKIQGDYIGAMARVAKMDRKDLEALHVDPTDGPLTNAILARLKSDPTLADVKIQVGAKTVKTGANGETITTSRKSVTTNDQKKFDAHGLDIEYATKLRAEIQSDTVNMKYKPKGHAGDLISEWVGAGGADLSLGAHLDAQLSGRYARPHLRTEEVKALDDYRTIYNSTESVKLRTFMKSIADPVDGKIALYRGWKTEVGGQKGTKSLLSYGISFEKAKQFTGHNGVVELYRIDPDDIVAAFKDIGPGSDNVEVIVRAGHRQPAAALSASGNLRFNLQGATGSTTTEITNTIIKTVGGGATAPRLGIQELAETLWAQKQNAIMDLVGEGIPFESIAIKTNTPLSTVQAIANSKGAYTVSDFATQMSHTELNLLNAADDIKKVLDTTKAPVKIEGNVRLNQYAAAHSQLDKKNLTDMNDNVIMAFLAGSKSAAVRDFGSMMTEMRDALSMVRSQLGKGNNELGGTAFFNSFDFFARNMGDIGPVFSRISKKILDQQNKFIEQINSSVTTAFEQIKKEGHAAVVELNTAKMLNDSLVGHRLYKDKQFWQEVDKFDAAGKPVKILEPVKFAGENFYVRSKGVDDFLLKAQDNSKELRELANSHRKIVGTPDVNDIGLWLPSFNPVGKHIAYFHNKVEDLTSVIWAHSAAELETQVMSFKKLIEEKGWGATHGVYRKGVEQEMWSRLNGRLDPIHMQTADIAKLKGGSGAAAVPRSDTGIFQDLAGGYQHYITNQFRTLADVSLSDITGQLRIMSEMNRWGQDAQPLTLVQSVTQKKKDVAATLLDTLLGDGATKNYKGWESLNQGFETLTSYFMNGTANAFNRTIGKQINKEAKLPPGAQYAVENNAGEWVNMAGHKIPADQIEQMVKDKQIVKITGDNLKNVDYEAYALQAKELGMTNPFAAFDDAAAKMYGLSKLEDHPDTSKRAIFASNALAATMILRFGELAQPLVNAISMPILTSLAITSKMPAHFLGKAKSTAAVSPIQVMYEGIRAMHSPTWTPMSAKWEAEGFYSPLVSEANQTLKGARTFGGGPIAAVEKMVDSKIVQIGSKAADYSETLTRKVAMHTGGVLAKRLYPELDDAGVTIFARDFMDKALGNFHSTQRPVFFQGTLGVALGLFQTYSLTLGQSIYRHLELKDYKALGKAALMQGTLFGTSSLPGFKAVSEQIGEHFSDDHVDLSSGTYRALPNSMASAILYGLPSNLGPGLNTRGDADFRFPGLSGQNVVAINTAQEVGKTIGRVAEALKGQKEDAGQAMLQALSLQSISRPLARGAELATGYSITQKGNTVQTPEEVWTTTGVISRILATRPLEEVKLREAMHLNSYYGSIDKEAREKLTMQLRQAIRNDNLSDSAISKYSEEYMKHGGTPTGWRSAFNTALAKSPSDGKEALLEKLKPDNPLNYMINNLD